MPGGGENVVTGAGPSCSPPRGGARNAGRVRPEAAARARTRRGARGKGGKHVRAARRDAPAGQRAAARPSVAEPAVPPAPRGGPEPAPKPWDYFSSPKPRASAGSAPPSGCSPCVGGGARGRRARQVVCGEGGPRIGTGKGAETPPTTHRPSVPPRHEALRLLRIIPDAWPVGTRRRRGRTLAVGHGARRATRAKGRAGARPKALRLRSVFLCSLPRTQAACPGLWGRRPHFPEESRGADVMLG
ncbi:unnamed protein product [Lampetra planeri]